MGAGPSEDRAEETRQERRQKRRQSQRRRVPQHGASLKRVYPDAISKKQRQRRKKT
ncbi:MAG: hypothetical protein HY669_03905 [Chloroflexi bacterium]|nr:hypothetical protein [Chloroflexota bacterium]